MYWESLSFEEIKSRIFEALEINSSFYNHQIMGLPATYLDPKIFPNDAEFLKNSPFIKCLIENPNHIGIHTYHSSLPSFKGTQKIELDLLRICAEEIFNADSGSYDGYISPGGTECNIQALWIFREYFRKKYKVESAEIAVLFSEDSHYSVYKACNILQLQFHKINVNNDNRQLDIDHLERTIKRLKQLGIKYFIFVLNLGSTMFGSVDPIDKISTIINSFSLQCKIHIDAAFGGFIFPFTCPNHQFQFNNPIIDSISLDAHKMLEAPYGTGIFLIRKGMVDNISTSEASYIEGLDHTLCGSRSGANAIATWMILNVYGSEGMVEHMRNFVEKTDEICNALNSLGIKYFRNDNMNVVAILNGQIPEYICKKYTLVPDTHVEKPSWWKIVVMEHVNWDIINQFIKELKEVKSEPIGIC